MSNLIVIGMSPSANEGALGPCEGRFGHRVASLMGTTYERYLEETTRLNIVPWPVDAWPTRKAAALGGNLRPLLVGRVVLAFGGSVVTALGGSWYGAAGSMHGQTLQTVGGKIYLLDIPHPSGLSRYWNEPGNVERAGEVLSEMWRHRATLASMAAGGRLRWT